MVARFYIALALSCLAATAAGWTDRNEYDLVLKIRGEASPQKRLALLEQWKGSYPKTELRNVRNELFIAAHQQVGDNAKVLAAAREILADQPDNPVGLYWCALLAPESSDRSPELLSAAEKAARGLLSAKVADPVWQKQKPEIDLMAHRTLGWVHWQRKDLPAAEEEFTKCLQQNAKDARVSAWFGAMLAAQPEPEKQMVAIWHLARAASLKDEGLSEPQRRQLGPVVDRFYTSYHGSEEGLEALRASVLASAFPPPGFSIESAAVIAARRAEEELAFRNPQLSAWLKIKKRLTAPDGETYFAASLRGADLPKLRGTLVRATPAKKPTELVLALSDPTGEEVTLKLSSALQGDAEAGVQLDFEATGDEFTATPFRLVLLSSPDKVGGWPTTARK
jgi:hypothetical protein